MKAPVSVSVVSSLFLAIWAGFGTASGETNDLVRANASTSELSLSRSSSQILQLTQAGMEESVITSFISNSGIFQLSADQIIYLKDLGVSGRVIEAMLTHDRNKFASSSQTNASNPSVALQRDTATATSVEMVTSGNLVQTNVQASAQSPQPGVNLVTSPKTETLPYQDLVVAQSLTPPQPAPLKKKVFYPVRAPYPVELTAPIVVLDAPAF